MVEIEDRTEKIAPARLWDVSARIQAKTLRSSER